MKKFSCHGCGGCCHGPIALTLAEAKYKFYDDFPLVVTFIVSDVRNVPVENDKTRYAKGMKSFNRNVIGFYDKTKSNRKIVVHPQILTLIPPDTPCVHLNELNLCTIYDRKPSVCTLYPVRIDTPVSLIEHGLYRERNQAFEGSAHIPCQGWSEDSAVFFNESGPVDKKTIPLLKSRNEEASFTRDLMKKFFFFAKEKYDLNDKIERYSELNIETNQFIQLPYSLFVDWMINNNYVHPVVGRSLIDSQINNIKIAESKNNSRVDDVGNTFKAIYTSHLEQIRNIQNR